MSPSTFVCLPPATPGLALAVAAPAVPAPGAGTQPRNAHVWREIAYFLGGFEVLAAQRQALGAIEFESSEAPASGQAQRRTLAGGAR